MDGVGLMSEAVKIEVVHATHDALFTALASSWNSRSEVASFAQAKFLARYMSDLGAATLVIEHEYVDRDYLDDYANYYAKCFTAYHRLCRRIHVFRHTFDRHYLDAAVRGGPGNAEETKLREPGCYLGFVVGRPIPRAVVGRTCLAIYNETDERRYPTAALYDADLLGIRLQVRTLPYQEQDHAVAACATVALWSSFHATARLFGGRTASPAQITRAAHTTHHYGRPLPSTGLQIPQMCSAVRFADLDPEIIDVKSNVPLKSAAYAYLRAGIPVILGVRVEGRGLHAMTIAGYRMQPLQPDSVTTDPPPTEVASNRTCAPLTGRRIARFYVHDDQIGPFARIVPEPAQQTGFDSQKSPPLVFRGGWQDDLGRARVLSPVFLLIPTYTKIRVRFLDVLTIVERVHKMLNLVMGTLRKPAGATEAAMEWDIHLTTIGALRESARASPADPGARDLMYMRHPRFVWRVTLSLGPRRGLDLLVDATDMDRGVPVYWAFWADGELARAWSRCLVSPSLRKLLEAGLGPPLLEALAPAAAG